MKKPFKATYYPLVFLLFACSSLWAQHKFHNVFRLTTEDGLADNHVNDIQQGENGFIWIATHDGLCRYDGSQIKVYQRESKKRNTLLYNKVSKVLPDKNRIWLATGIGLSVLDIQADTFTNYIYNKEGKRFGRVPKNHLPINNIFRDKDGNIWCITSGNGIGRYIVEEDDFEFFKYPGNDHREVLPNPERVDNILSICEHLYNDSIFFLGTIAGLLEFNKYSKSMTWHYFPKADKSLESNLNKFRRIYFHQDGMLYTGGWSGGVNVFDPNLGTLVKLPENGGPSGFVSINDIRKKSDEEIWFTSGLGLQIYNTGLGKFTRTWNSNIRLDKYYGANCIDRGNRFWVKSFNGAYYYDPVLQQFSIHPYDHLGGDFWGFARSIISDSTGQQLTVCVQNGIGLYEFNRIDQQWNVVPVSKKYYSKNTNGLNCNKMIRSPGGTWTIDNVSTLLQYDPVSKKLTDLPLQPKLDYRSITDILWDSRGYLWIGTNQDGLLRWDPKTGRYRNFQKGLDASGPELYTSFSNHLFEDSQQNIWLNRNKGFSVYLTEKDTMLNLLSPVNKDYTFSTAKNFTEDAKGRIWITGRHGFVGYADVRQPEKGIVKKINLAKRDPSIDWIDRMIADKKGDIWVLSNENLLKIDAESLEVSLFSFKYGLIENEFFAFDFLPTGEMYIGLRDKIVTVDPDDLKKNIELPVPYLTGIQVSDLEYGKDSTALVRKALHLEHWENSFSFDFSAKSFVLAEQNQFQYRLKNFKDEWIDAQGRRFANYTNVPDGEYLFELKAANNEGIWNEEIYELPVSIATPWWKTWWFRILALLLLSAFAYSIYRYRVLQIRKEERLKSEFEKQLINVEMNALRAQMNPHFLFNCLNSIDSYIIKNETKKASEYLNKFARLIRLILQNSRSNYINLSDELESLDLYMSMESLRFRNKFDYEIDVEEGIETESIDIPPMLIQPFIENAIWHGLMHISDDYKGKVRLTVQKQNGSLNCIIEDNGIGREKSAEIQKRKHTKRRKSMGMRITQDRIEMINKLYDSTTSVKIIDLKDENGKAKGTRVELKIPV